MRSQIGITIGLCFVSAACVLHPPGDILTQAEAKNVPAKMSERRSLPVRTNSSRAITAEWVVWDWIQCDANWEQYCTMNESADANPEWDACKPIWGKISAGKGGPRWSVTMRDHNRVTYSMYVKGSWNPTDQWGSMLRVENVGMIVISVGATLAERKAAGCVENFSYSTRQRQRN